jgi:hypothetical protein
MKNTTCKQAVANFCCSPQLHFKRGVKVELADFFYKVTDKVTEVLRGAGKYIDEDDTRVTVLL